MANHYVTVQTLSPRPSRQGRGDANAWFEQTPSPLVGEGWGGGLNAYTAIPI